MGSRNVYRNKEAVDPLLISFKETFKGENVSNDWQVPLG
jgi:hypothetical protein